MNPRNFRVAAVIAAVISAITAPAAAQLATVGDVENSSSRVLHAPTMNTTTNTFDGGEYWTTDRMRSATPADTPMGAMGDARWPFPGLHETFGRSTRDVADGVAPSVAEPGQGPAVTGEQSPGESSEAAERGAASTVVTEVAPATVGKFFFTNLDGKDRVCTASVIQHPKRNVILTAGHCVYSTGKGWHTNLAFAPGYHDGPHPDFGVWRYESARAFERYQNEGRMSHDQAMVGLAPRESDGALIQDVVGANELQWDQGPEHKSVRVWGYPVVGDFKGNTTAQRCDGAARDRSVFDDDSVVSCPMTGGASGGPWLRGYGGPDAAGVFAVTSRRNGLGIPELYAVPNTSKVKSMYDLM